jgi:hypothetical protein
VNLGSKLFLSLGVRWIESLRPQFVHSPSLDELPNSGILALWHEHMLLCLPAFARRGMRVLISQSRDGEWGVQAAERLGYSAVRGSSTRGGVGALRQLAPELSHNGGWAALVVDGPRGPRRISKPGAVWLSQKTGLPVFTVSAHAPVALRLNSWDRCVVPLPFSRIKLQLSAPLYPTRTGEIDDALNASVF